MTDHTNNSRSSWSLRRLTGLVLPLLSAMVLIALLSVLMLSTQGNLDPQDDTVTVRKIDLALPLPPPPPPPIEIQREQSESSSPNINLIGMGNGPALNYSDTPTLSMTHIEKVEKPEFDLASLDLRKTLELDFPVVDVKNLDEVPRAISYKTSAYPRQLSARGIKKIPTKVLIIIDEQGKAYVKKIVDPVYPEMIEVIRAWVKSARFTLPTKNGQPVQAVYLYTLLFNYRS